MTPQLDISVAGHLGVIALNRPEAINALSREMIDGIAETLAGWRDDAQIRAVLFEGRGPRGFCAGGDVRAARSLVLAGKAAEADAYFAAEYAMNEMIATYPKPIAAIGHGVAMGGGLGILSHARFSFATMDARFAMPEAAIGFVPDVGINAILALVPEARALAFLLSGLAVGPGDALTLGLCDAAIDPARAGAVRSGIAAASAATDVETALVQLMQAESLEPDDAVLCAQADRLAEVFAGATAGEIAKGIAQAVTTHDSGLDGLAQALAGRSPTSLAAILAGHRLARQNPEIAVVLGIDLRLASFMARQPDFAEGVRAVLVDKDQKPQWRPASLAEVDVGAIDEVARSHF
ncbi:MAG TPA: enoyl-CoA hydratase/isomerase family protein [Devosiaceae bacterium]|nr:enoyl-CoA hydratase/isomerase family protein [Devosiaceae bacterium]